jgi:hypothetical protein
MQGIHNGIICERENQIKIPFDSVAPVLFKINYHSDSISNFMINKDIQNQRDCIFNYNYGGYLTLGNNKEIYYFNPENGVFVRLNTDKKSGENVELIKPGGILKDVFHDYDCKNYSKTNKGYICFGMTYFIDKLVIYLVKSDSVGNINESKIQVYQNQEFIREFNPTFNDEDDILLKSYLIGHKDDWILMLNKWKNKRWVITKVNIK